jgi:tRNA1(Val) A37 N6-methylase TrmN6
VTGPAPEGSVPETTVDKFLGGRITLVQPRKGHRAGLDAALLQALVPADASGCAIDLGTGVGSVALSLAARAPALSVTGVERDPALIKCARSALMLPENAHFAARVSLIQADVAALASGGTRNEIAPNSADWLLMNPPWDVPGAVRASPDPARRAAHIGETGTLGTWIRAAAALLKPAGTLGLIHRAQAQGQVLEALAEEFGDIRILPTQPKKDLPPTRILVRAMKGSGGGVALLPGLILHEADGRWTAEADPVLRGDAGLAV